MPRTVESIVACHQEARARRRAGRPIWDLELPVKSVLQDYENPGESLKAEHAAELCQRLHTLLTARIPPAWLECTHPKFCYDLEDLLDEIKEAGQADYYSPDRSSPADQVDELLTGLYDWGDKVRVWIG